MNIEDDFTVSISESDPPAVTEVGVIKDSSDLPFRLEVVLPPNIYENYTTIWFSSNSKYSVDSNGLMSFSGPLPSRPQRDAVEFTAIVIVRKTVIGTPTATLEMSVRGI